MSATTISAVLGRLGGISARYDFYGQLVDAQAFDDLDGELGGTTLDVDHNGEQVGELVYVEVSPENQIGLVAVVDGDWPFTAEAEGPLYISGEYVTRGRSSAGPTYIAKQATLRSAAVTWTPARTGDARAARLWPGDIRSSADRRNWPISWERKDPLLARALAYGRWATEVPRVVNLRDDGSNPLGLKPGDPAPSGYLRSRDLPGGLRRSAHVGRVISVR
jgi:hypothetical protein